MEILKYYRVSDWYYYLGFIILGFTLNSLLNIDIIKHLLLGSFLLAYAYSLNDFSDKNEKKKFFIFPLILSILLLPFFNNFQILTSLIFLMIVTLYSVYPFRWKSKPFISSFCNGFGFTIIFLLGYFYISTLNLNGILLASLFFCFNMVAQFMHEIIHLDKDKKRNIITTAVFLNDRVKNICHAFHLLAITFIFILLYYNFLNTIISSAMLLFIIWFTIRIETIEINEKIRKEYKNFGILIGIIYFILNIFKL